MNSIVIDCPTAPGFARMNRSTIDARLLLGGTWTIGASLRVNVKGSILFVPSNDTFSVDLSVKQVRAGVRVDLDSSDPAAPRIVHVEPPEADLHGHISTSHEARPLFSQLGPNVSKALLDHLTDDGTMAGIANAIVLAGVRQFFESLDLVIAATPEVFGDGGPAPAPVKPVDLEAAALSIGQEIREAKTPYGAVVQTRDLVADPASGATLGAENANLLTRWLRGPRRRIVTDLTSDPTIARTVYVPPIDPRLTFMLAEPTASVMIAKYPIPVEKRVSSGFAWSESPFRLEAGYPSNPDPFIEGEGIDFLLPYWMTRYYGAIKLAGK